VQALDHIHGHLAIAIYLITQRTVRFALGLMTIRTHPSCKTVNGYKTVNDRINYYDDDRSIWTQIIHLPFVF